MTYTFPSAVYPESVLDELEKEIKKAVLPKYGYNRNTPNAVVYGHSEFAGVEMRKLNVEQGIGQLYYLLMSLRADGVSRDLAQIAISWAQLLAGTSISIFSDTETKLPHLDPMKWLPAIRDFLASMKCTLEMDKNYIPELQRENDLFLMDVALKEKYKPNQIKLINACRIYKGVTLLSDVVNAKGNKIREDMMNQEKPQDDHKGLMPYQDLPSTNAWELWKRLLHTFTYHKSERLTSPMGRWFVSGELCHRQWRSYHCQKDDIVFIWKNKEYEIYTKNNNEFIYSKTTVKQIPSSCVPVDLDLSQPRITRRSSSTVYPKFATCNPTNFESYIATLPTWEQALLQNIEFQEDIFQFSEYLQSSTDTPGIWIYATSDGSAPEFIGSFGWACKLSNGQFVAKNNGPAHGFRTTSFRAESYGLLSYLLLLRRACCYTQCPLPSKVRLHSDSKSALEKILDMITWPYYYPNATMSPDWDVLQAIVSLLREFPKTPQLIHVKGHQDNNQTYAQLSMPAQLNVDADKLAGDFEYRPSDDPTIAPLIAGNSVSLQCPTGTISSKYRQNIRKMKSAPIMKQHICQNNL